MTTELISRHKDKRELPDGWRWVKLGDVCEVKGGKRLPAGADFATGVTPFPYIRVVDFQSGTVRLDSLRYLDKEIHLQISRYIINRDDVYISIAGSIGIVGVIPDELDGANLTENAARIVIKERSVLFRDFLAKYLHSPLGQESIKHRTNVVGQPKLALERIATIEIPLAPLDEQRRIAAILDEQMEAVERSRQATLAQLEAAKAFPAAYLRAVFNSLEAQKWERKPLGEVCQLLPSKSIATDGDTEVLAITTACLTETGFDPSGVKKARMWANDAAECVVSPGEILVARSNTAELVGRVSVFEGEPIGAVASDLTIRIWTKPDIYTRFLASYLSFLSISGFWKERSGGSSWSMKKITRTQISDLPIPVPLIDEQKRVTETFNEQMAEVERLQKSLKSQLNAINKLPATLLRRAFNGELY